MKKQIARWFIKLREVHLQKFSNLEPIPPLRYCSEYHFILEHGRIFKFHPRRSHVKNPQTPVVENQCYRNSIQYAIASGMRYVEGYGISQRRGFMDHAWCVNEHNNVRDVSWEDGLFYFGVEIPLSYVIAKNNGTTDYLSCRPLLREEDEAFEKYSGILDFSISPKNEKEINPRCRDILMGEVKLS